MISYLKTFINDFVNITNKRYMTFGSVCEKHAIVAVFLSRLKKKP